MLSELWVGFIVIYMFDDLCDWLIVVEIGLDDGSFMELFVMDRDEVFGLIYVD